MQCGKPDSNLIHLLSASQTAQVSLFLNNFFLKVVILLNWFCTNMYSKLLIFSSVNQSLEMLRRNVMYVFS